MTRMYVPFCTVCIQGQFPPSIWVGSMSFQPPFFAWPLMSSVTTFPTSCYEDFLGTGLSYASATLFIYDYFVTLFDESRFIWFQRVSTSTVLFYVARYGGMASALLTMCQTPATSLVAANLGTALRFLVIASAEAVLAIRTWAIWEKRKSILVLLCLVSATAVGMNVWLFLRGVNATHETTTEWGCITITNSRSKAYLSDFVMVIAYEMITLILSTTQIVRLQTQLAPSARMPLLDTLWNDGLLYFSWMIALGIVNIILIPHENAFVQTGGSQLQSSIHSILAVRIILHLASLSRARERDNQGSGSIHVSSLFTPTTLELRNSTNNEVGLGHYSRELP